MGYVLVKQTLYIRKVKVHLQLRDASVIGSAVLLKGDLRTQRVTYFNLGCKPYILGHWITNKTVYPDVQEVNVATDNECIKYCMMVAGAAGLWV